MKGEGHTSQTGNNKTESLGWLGTSVRIGNQKKGDQSSEVEERENGEAKRGA